MKIYFIFIVFLFACCAIEQNDTRPLALDEPVKGWLILSNDIEGGLRTIEHARKYNINHLQISHEVIHDLRHVRDKERLKVAEILTEAAHNAGIQEVAFWDRALYPMDYYPERYKTGPGGTIDLDDPDFWEWFKYDYREMLELAPDIQALILTFIETGARVEHQHSDEMVTDSEKLAAVVNAVADVVIGEYGMNLYARTFAYDHEEYERIIGAIDLFEYDEIRLMMKETPHDFFITHPLDFIAGEIARPTLMEFDAAGEFHGQGIVLNTFPEVFLERWADFLRRDHIIGYVARTDRYGTTQIVDQPTEIHLKALHMYFEDRSVIENDVYRTFITEQYGERAYPMLKQAFKNSKGITLATFYTLNNNTTDHSRLNYDPYPSSYARHVSGRWLDPPVTYVSRGVNKEFHYWEDIINTIAPNWAKMGGAQLEEAPWVVEKGWLDHDERMNEEYLRYILIEKEYGIALAQENLKHLEAAKPHLNEKDYEELYHHFNHTLLTISLHREVAAVYWGFRIYIRGPEYRSNYVINTLNQALINILHVADEIENYPVKPPAGQWNWVEDAEMARTYHRWITHDGWPEDIRGFHVSFGGQIYRP